MQRQPYHADTLLQLSEVFSMQGDMSNAIDFIERTLFVLEGAFHTKFNPALGNCRLPYKYYENRVFFLALFKYIRDIGDKGMFIGYGLG